MRFPYFLSYALQTPWAMDPAAMHTYASLLVRAYGRKAGVLAGDHRDDTQYGDDGQPIKAAKASGQQGVRGGIGLVNVFGTIMQRASDFGPCEGGTGCEDISAALRAARTDESVSQVLMNFATPGGSVFGIQELGDEIRALRAVKPVVGISNSMCGSAGYWLLSQCSEAYCTPGGQAGSVGVYSAHQCVAKAMEAEGIEWKLISAGKYKVEGNPFEPLSAEAEAAMQATVDAYYRMFTQAVARGRNVPVDQVREGFGQGRMLLADDALKAGMVDGVMTFEQVVRKMQSAGRARGAARVAAMQADIAGVM